MELSLSVVRQAAHYRTTGKLSQCRAGFYAAVAQPADILILELKAESLLPAQFQTFSASPPNRGFWAGSGLSAFEFTFGKIDIRGAISRCEALL